MYTRDGTATYRGYGDSLDREDYERELRERQRRHLDQLERGTGFGPPWQPCLHDGCPNCHGTGVGIHGACVHSLSCPCPKCTPYC